MTAPAPVPGRAPARGPDPAPVPGRAPVRVGPLSATWRPRIVLVTVLAAAAAVGLAATNVLLGGYLIAPLDVLRALLGGGDGAARFVVLELRLPRALAGLAVGAALGVAGAITQSLARNPLASPDMLGVTEGAGAAAVAVTVFAGVGPLASVASVPVGALIGGLGAAALVYALAYRRTAALGARPGLDGYRLVLVGIGVTTAAASLTGWLLVSARIEQVGQAMVWLRGSLTDRTWTDVAPVGLAVLVLTPVAVALGTRLGVLRLDDDSALGLGLRLSRSRGWLLLVAVLLAATATACAGPVRFVALVAPRIAERACRAEGPPLLASAATGALLTVAADLLTRLVLGDALPVGIVTVVLGAPFLLYLLLRHRREAVR